LKYATGASFQIVPYSPLNIVFLYRTMLNNIFISNSVIKTRKVQSTDIHYFSFLMLFRICHLKYA